jgi:hypothetical protein
MAIVSMGVTHIDRTFIADDNVLEDDRTVEVTDLGCEGMFARLSALVAPESFGRSTVNVSGTASRIASELINEAECLGQTWVNRIRLTQA